jgi:hypothetical protein
MLDYTLDETFDCELVKSKYIKYLPYIGKKYKDQKSRILILGESHYISEEDYKDIKTINKDKYFTRSIFLDCYFPEIRDDGSHPYDWVRCYRNTAAMITGKYYNSSDYIWQNLAFYNFFQSVVGVGSKGKDFITDELINDSRIAFYEVVRILKPNLIIAWGKDKLFYNWMPKDEWAYIDEDKLCYKYINIPKTSIWHIHHPSQGFSYRDYNKVFVELAKILEL